MLVKPCGFRIDRTEAELGVVQDLLEHVDWPAKHSGDVWIADGNAFFNRPGPRIVDSLEILAACLHPRAFADLADQQDGNFRRLH